MKEKGAAVYTNRTGKEREIAEETERRRETKSEDGISANDEIKGNVVKEATSEVPTKREVLTKWAQADISTEATADKMKKRQEPKELSNRNVQREEKEKFWVTDGSYRREETDQYRDKGRKEIKRNDFKTEEGESKLLKQNSDLRKFPDKNKLDDEDAEYEIPVHRKRREKTQKNNFSKDSLFMKKKKRKEYEQDDAGIHFLDMFDFEHFPVFLFEKKKKEKKINEEKKYLIEFLDTFNDDFVKKNIHKNAILESIDICKGISFLNINNNINTKCLGWKENAFYFYKMIPLRTIYSKETIQKIMEKKTEEIPKRGNRDQTEQHSISSWNEQSNDSYFSQKLQSLRNMFSSNRTDKKESGRRDRETIEQEEKESKVFNDLYLMPYEKNLKSSICLGTHIYSKERAVKKCFGVLIERNIYTGESGNEENTNVQNNLENLFFNFPYNQKNILFKPVFYAYKNKKIVDVSFFNAFKNVQWDKMYNLKKKEFYFDLKKKIFNFTKDVYYTTKNSIAHFDSPKEFISQTTQRAKDINIKMKQICEKSFYIAHNLLLKMGKTSKAS